jgi:ABC-type transporter Mla maintaining outer membrane lipid asymmetry ATPase subunit MlaF
VIVTHELQSVFAIVKHCVMLGPATPRASSRAAIRASCVTGSTDPRVTRFLNRRAGRGLIVAQKTNHWKLGLFVVTGLAIGPGRGPSGSGSGG